MFLETLLNLIFPSACLSCRKRLKSGGVICEQCFAGAKINETLFCGKCGARLPSNRKECHKDFPYLLGAATDYGEETVKNLVHNFKFKCLRAAAEPLAKLLIRYVENLRIPFTDYLIIPIPLSGKRLRERGFNQSELIAKIFALHFGLLMETKNFLRTKNTKAQSETKNLKERCENVKGCFAVNNPELFRGKKIILVDDVTTSGATFLEAARVLKSAGAKKVIALAVARA
jgi:ComF family protein